jgi:hypothetical protein
MSGIMWLTRRTVSLFAMNLMAKDVNVKKNNENKVHESLFFLRVF